MLKSILLSLLILFAISEINAQVNASDSAIAAFVPHVSQSYQFSGGDIAKRYRNNSTIGGGVRYKTSKNLIFSFDGNSYNYKEEEKVV